MAKHKENLAAACTQKTPLVQCVRKPGWRGVRREIGWVERWRSYDTGKGLKRENGNACVYIRGSCSQRGTEAAMLYVLCCWSKGRLPSRQVRQTPPSYRCPFRNTLAPDTGKKKYSRRFLKLLVISFGLRHIHLLCVYAVQSFPRSLHEHFHSLLHCCDGSNGAEQTTRDARPIRLCRAVGNHLGGASRLFLHRFHSQPMGRNEAVLQVKKRRTFL